jgi:hypothetical protein
VKIGATKFFWICLVLIVSALVCHYAGLGRIGSSVQTRAKMISLPAEQRAEFKAQADLRKSQGFALIRSGYALAAVSLVACVLSARRKEAISRGIPVGLQVAYALSQFILV